MSQSILFDQSTSAFVKVLLGVFDRGDLENGWILRDASGRLAFVATRILPELERAKLVIDIERSLQGYSRGDSSVLHIDQPGIKLLVESSYCFSDAISIDESNSIRVKVIDHRIVGQDWLTPPAPGWQPPAPARFVFASMKGGVGRSTALAVLATELAREGRKLLVIDLDLEAPGIGTMLIKEQEKPLLGVLDWYLEQGISGINDPDFFSDMLSPSPFGAGKGLIDVAPAVGRSSDENPANVLSKLARAYLESSRESGPPTSFLALTQSLIEQLSAQKTYDAILVDARAGLNESTAAAVLGLGADVLLFGVNSPQTFSSYRYLFAHLARFARKEPDDWLYRLRMVHAKASPDAKLQSAFRDQAYGIFSEFLYRDQPVVESGEESEGLSLADQFGLDDPVGPHYAWPILSDSNYAEFDPLNLQSQLMPDFYERSYAGLIAGIRNLLDDSGTSS